MRFAVALPLWGYVFAFAAALLLAWLAYARLALKLTRPQRALLTGLRAITLVLLEAVHFSGAVTIVLLTVSSSLRGSTLARDSSGVMSTALSSDAHLLGCTRTRGPCLNEHRGYCDATRRG